MTMIEKVARAISPTCWNDTLTEMMRPDAIETGRLLALESARAAIEAMREPTDAMCEAGARYYHDNWRPGHAKEDTNMALIWTDMIDAALSTQPTS